MKLDQMFPSKWLHSDDLQGKRIKVEIADVAIETFDNGDEKPIVSFRNGKKLLVLIRPTRGRLQRSPGVMIRTIGKGCRSRWKRSWWIIRARAAKGSGCFPWSHIRQNPRN